MQYTQIISDTPWELTYGMGPYGSNLTATGNELK